MRYCAVEALFCVFYFFLKHVNVFAGKTIAEEL